MQDNTKININYDHKFENMSYQIQRRQSNTPYSVTLLAKWLLVYSQMLLQEL